MISAYEAKELVRVSDAAIATLQVELDSRIREAATKGLRQIEYGTKHYEEDEKVPVEDELIRRLSRTLVLLGYVCRWEQTTQLHVPVSFGIQADDSPVRRQGAYGLVIRW